MDLKKITMPLINFYGLYDHLVPPAACELLTSKVCSKDKTDVCLKTGHIGIYVSFKFQKEFAPEIASWLKEREHEKPKRKVPKKASKPKTAPKKRRKPAPSPK